VKPQSVLVVVTLLLGLTSAASADCGWVLWVEHRLSGGLADNEAGMPTTKWELRYAYDTNQMCEVQKVAQADLAFLSKGSPRPLAPASTEPSGLLLTIRSGRSTGASLAAAFRPRTGRPSSAFQEP